MSNESTNPSARALAFERLIDQLAPGPGHVAPEARAARRLCGRWLLMRRAARRLSHAQVAERTGLSEGAIELLEQGLLGRPAGPDEGWQRLCLVLERHGDNDLPRVAAAVDLACGRATALDAAFLAGLEAEIAVPEAEPAPAPRPLAETAQELIDILAAIGALRAPVTAYQVKKWVAANRGKSWNPAELPRTMAALAHDGLVRRTEARPVGYALTEAGAEILALAEQRERARSAEQQARAEERQAQAALAVRLSPLTGGL